MPLQVLERQKAPDYSGIAESFQKGRELASDIVYKKGLVDYNKELLKMHAKEAETEAEKAKYEKMVKRWEVASKVIDYGKSVAQETVNGVTRINQEKWEKYITTVIVNNPELAEVFGSDELRKMTPSIEAKERLEGSAASLIERELGGGQQLPGAAPVQNGEASGVEPTNQGRIGAMGGGWVPEKIQAGPISLTNPVRQEATERRMVRARAEEARDVEMTPIRTSVMNYLNVFDNAVNELGGLSENALQSLARGRTAELGSQIGNKPNIFALNKLIEPVSLQLGSYLNRGRPTDKDQSAAKSMLTRITYTKGANQILRHYLESVIATGDRELATKLFWTLAKEGGSNSKDAKAYSDPTMLSGPATSRFTIKVKE